MLLELYKSPNFITFGNVGSGRGVVSTVNGKTGEVVLDTSDIAESDSAKYMTAAEREKLASLTPGSTGGGNTGPQIKALYEAEPNTNAFDDAALAKLSGIAIGATADQTGSQIKALYEAEADTNVFSDTEKAKLAGISPGGGGNVQADMATTSPVDGSYIHGMGTAGRSIAQAENADAVRAMIGVEQGFETIANMLASTQTASEGYEWKAGGHTYVVASASETAPHLTTAGGVKLFVKATDDGIFNFAAFDPAADGVTDDGPKLALALAAQMNGTGFYQSGPALFLPNASYFVGQTINLKRATKLFGNSSGLPSDSGPMLIFPPDVIGIIVNRYNTFGEQIEAPPTTGADASIIEGIKLKSTLGDDATKHAIRLRARAIIRNVNISGFSGDGINIKASAGTSDPAVEGNANNWQVETVRITGCGGNGIYVDGADANAGVCIGADCSQNGRWAIWDSSFLGNTYLACHAAENGLAGVANNSSAQTSLVSYNNIRWGAHPNATAAQLVATTPGTDDTVWVEILAGAPNVYSPLWQPGQPAGTFFQGGAYYADNANARNLFLGCYSETGTAGSAFVGPCLVLGGSMGHINQGSTIQATNGGEVKLDGLELVDEQVSVKIAGDPDNGDILKWSHDDDSSFWPWRLHRRGNDFALDNANVGSRTAFNLTGENTTLNMGTSSPKPYLMSFPMLGLGSGGNTRRQTYGAAPPVAGDYARGDIVYNISPSAGGKVGWVCTAAGSPGTWKPFGSIDT